MDKEIERLLKEKKELEPYVDYMGQIPTLTKDNTKEFIAYITKEAKLTAYQDVLEMLKNQSPQVNSKVGRFSRTR